MTKNKWDQYYRPLERMIEKNDTLDKEVIKKAFYFAADIHKNQKRKTGEPYIIHPVSVAQILIDIGPAGNTTVCSAIMHDVLEDAENVVAADYYIYNNFSENIYFNVHALSKNTHISNKINQQLDYLDQFKKAAEMDPIVMFVKLADLLHNLSTLGGLSQERRKTWLNELKYQYLPILSDLYPLLSFEYHNMYHVLSDRIHFSLEKESFLFN